MSKNIQGILGPQYGKIGPVVGYTWKGKPCFRAYTNRVKQPNTVNQQIARAIFKTFQMLSCKFQPAINLGFMMKSISDQVTTRNVFTKVNNELNVVSAAAPDSVSIDYTSIVVSQGPLQQAFFGAPQADNPGQIDVAITGNNFGDATANDKIVLVAYIPDLKLCIVDKTATRASVAGHITTPAIASGMKAHIWGFARAGVSEPTFIPDYGAEMLPGQCSDSAYLGSVTIS